MKIGTYDIKPLLLTLPDTPDWKARGERGESYLRSQGFDDLHVYSGIHGAKWGIQGRHIYLADNRPEEQYYIGDGQVAGNISQYIGYSIMNALPDSHFMFMEDDIEFVEGWREKLAIELENVPADFDVLFVGSCCAENKEPTHIAGSVYEFPYRGKEKWNWYPQCSHCIIFAKKSVPYIISTNRSVASPADVSIIQNSYPALKVYAILPRLATQGSKTQLEP